MDNYIKPGNYIGYLWKSNSAEPEIYYPAPRTIAEMPLNPKENPFIVEGMLYDDSSKLSYSITFNDGKYIVKEYNLNNIISQKHSIRRYFGNRMKDLYLKFIEVYKETKTEDECGLTVWEPSSLVFTGFEK